MMVKKIRHMDRGLYLTAILIGYCLCAQAQFGTGPTKKRSLYSSLSNRGDVKPLSIGDIVPDFEINYITNYVQPSANISSFRGKLLIIDFWEVYCSSCIATLPKLDSLQSQFSMEIQILTVTKKSSKDETFARLNSFRRTRNLRLPIVINDEILYKYFPFELTSHVIWIDTSGKVLAITGTEYITAKNIKSVLSGIAIKWPVKRDIISFNYSKPLLVFNEETGGTQPTMLFYSALTSHMEGVDSKIRHLVDKEKNIQTFNYYNFDLLQLARQSVENASGGINRKIVVFNVNELSRYIIDGNVQYLDVWQKQNTFCYSLTLPLNSSKEDQKSIEREDLSRWLKAIFKVTMTKERRLMSCLVIVNKDEPQTNAGTRGGTYVIEVENDSKIKRLSNTSISNLVWYLNDNVPDIPWVIDESGYSDKSKVTLEFNIDSMNKIYDLKQQLQQFGLDLLEEKREMEVYILSDSK